MKNYYQNKVAIVTGGASGLGKALAEALSGLGARVIIADLDVSGAKEAASHINRNGGIASVYQADVSQKKQVEKLVEDTVKEYGRIDFLFNNAGLAINGEFQDMGLEHWEKLTNVNYWGVVYGCYYVYPVMKKQGFGHIVNTASLAGLIPGGLIAPYSATKYAVAGLSLTLRAEGKQYGIRVSALCPGFLNTTIHEKSPNLTGYLDVLRKKQMVGGKNWPAPEKVAPAILEAVRKNKGIIIVPKKQKIFWWAYRIFPALIPRVWQRVIRKLKKENPA